MSKRDREIRRALLFKEGTVRVGLSCMPGIIALILLLPAHSGYAAERLPSITVSKDAVTFRVPAQSLDDDWEIRFPVGTWAGWESDGTAHISPYDYHVPVFMAKGDSALFRRELDFTWTGDKSVCRFPWATPVFADGMVRFSLRGEGAEPFSRLRPLGAVLHGFRADGSAYQVPFVVTFEKDPREERARSLSGPFSPDEYAIYQTVLDRLWKYDARWDFVLLSPTHGRGPVTVEHALEKLRPDPDTVADYEANRAVGVELSSLKPLGYEVVPDSVYWARWRTLKGASRHRQVVEVTMIGFNDARTQALVLVGMDGGELIRLDKVEGEWLVTGRAGTYHGY